jgi:hypothetical protein
MRFKPSLLLVGVVICFTPLYGLCNGILDFGIPLFKPGKTLIVSSVTGFGGASNSGLTLPITSGSLSLTGANWPSGGTVDLTVSGTIGPLNLAGQTLLRGSFAGASISGGGVSLDGFSGSINPVLTGYYGVGDSAAGGSVYLQGWSAVLAVDPNAGAPVATPEAGGLLPNAVVVLLGALLLLAAARTKIIRPAV